MELNKKNNLPRAIAKEKDGIVLYWCEELQIAGLHVKSLMKMLQVENSFVSDTVTGLEGARRITRLEVEIVTPGGLQRGTLITESDLPVVLRKIERSRAKEVVRDLAGDLRDKLAAAGFKLLVMLELAPQQLAAQVQQHAMPQTFAQALFLAAQQQAEIEALEQNKKLLEGEIEVCNEVIQEQAEVVDDLFSYSSIIRIAKFNKCSEKNFNWRRLKSASLAMGIEIRTCPDPNFGKKNLYHHDAWRIAYPEANLPETTTLKIDDSLR
jgi:hypothetical protein